MKEQKLKVAIIIPGGVGTGKNNIGVPVLESLIRLMSRDSKVTVFQLYRKNKSYQPSGFEFIDIYSKLPVIKSLKFAWSFWKVQRKTKFDVVHGFWAFPCGFLAALAGKIFQVKSVISLQGGDAISLPEIKYGQLYKWLSRKLVLWALHRVDVLVSPTQYLVHNLQKFGFNRKDIKYIPLGVDISLFMFRNKSLGQPIQFLHIANLHPVKDQVTLLKAFQIISNQVACHLTIIGEGIWERKIKLLAKELKISGMISFLAPITYEDLPPVYYQSDVLLHTSLSEGHPIVVEEAMSCGVVVCGTKVGLLYDLPECCVAVPVGDYGSLAGETLKLISDRLRMDAIRKRAHKWVTTHSARWTIENFKKIYVH